MTDRPVLYKGSMVLAQLGGRKTQTRRVMKRLRGFGAITEFGVSDTQGFDWHFRDQEQRWHDLTQDELLACLPWQVGDRLWVRETMRADCNDQGTRWLVYDADRTKPWGCDEWTGKREIVPSIHMPKYQSRLVNHVTRIWVEPVQAVSKADAIAEGLKCLSKDGKITFKYGIPDRDNWPGVDDFGWPWEDWEIDPRMAYRTLWDQINGHPEFCWDNNPWVFVTEFAVQKVNIFELGEAS